MERFYAVLSSTYSAMLLVTDDGVVEFVNQAFCDLFGLDGSPADMRGLTVQEAIGKIRHAYLNPEEAITRIMQIVAEGRTVTGEEVLLTGGRACIRDFVPIRLGHRHTARGVHHR